MNPAFKWQIITLCRGDDPDRAPKFNEALKVLHAEGKMGGLEDGPEQKPLKPQEIKKTIFSLLPHLEYDIIITHNLKGEYTRHRRHEEIGREVLGLWKKRKLLARELWLFAYEDGGGEYLPRPRPDADLATKLPKNIWQQKLRIITGIYDFSGHSFEARTTPATEAFYRFTDHEIIEKQIDRRFLT